MEADSARPKIFISYSRRDMAFADRIEAALKAHGFDPLIDRSDIYAFEDWWTRIQALITGADTILFVLSPDAIASDVCAREVAFAASLNKRFAPVIHRRVDGHQIPEALARLNFVFFDDDAHFDQAVERLVEALSTDIEWIRKHTEFGELARRWSQAGRPGPRGLLLRSPTLDEAERWIASRPRGAPEPTEDLRTFLAVSRSAATARRNLLTVSLGVGLLIALVLAGIALVQREIAVAAQKVASEQREVAVAAQKIASEQRETALSAQSSMLAAEAARTLGEGDTQTAILLSLEALRSPGDVGSERHSVEAEKALLEALYRNPLRAILHAGDHEKYVDAAFVSGTSVLATIRADGGVAFWKIDDGGRLVGPVDVRAPLTSVKAVFANPARPILIFRGQDDSYFAWNFETQQALPGIAGSCHGDEARFTFDPRGTRLFVYCDDVKIFVFDTGLISQVPGKFDRFALAPDGKLFAVAAGQTVTIMDAMTAAVITSWKEKDKVFGLGISYDDKTAFTSNFFGIHFHFTSTGKESQRALSPSQFLTEGLLVGNTLNIMVVKSYDGREVWNIDSLAPIQTLQGNADAFLPNGVLVNANESRITLWDYAIDTHSGSFYPVDRGDLKLSERHSFVTSSADGKKIVTLTDQEGDLYVWSSEPAMMQHAVQDDGEQLGAPAVFSANGKVIATVSHKDRPGLTTWDAATLTAMKHISLDKAPSKLAVSGDGRRLIYRNDDSTYDILDTATLVSIKPASVPAKANAVVLSPNGWTLAVRNINTISLWSLASAAKLHDCDIADAIGDIVWTDSGRIVYAKADGAIMILAPDSCTSKQILSFTTAASVKLRARRELLMAWTVDRLQVWSEAESKTIFDATNQQWPALADGVMNVDLLPGRRIIMSEAPADVHVYDLASRSEILSFPTDTRKHSVALEMDALPSGDGLIMLWSELGEPRLSTWRLLPTPSVASAVAKEVVPECLSLNARRKLGLDPAPPHWCIEMKKRPYDAPAWQHWLSDTKAGKLVPIPHSD